MSHRRHIGAGAPAARELAAPRSTAWVANAIAVMLVASLLHAGPVMAQPPGSSAPAGPWSVDDALWDRPRSAELVRTQPAVRAAVARLFETAGASLVIRHGRGQNAELQAEELRHWLVALAIDAPRIASVAEARMGGALVLEVRPASGLP